MHAFEQQVANYTLRKEAKRNKTFCEQRIKRMPTRLAILAAATVATAGGDAPGTHACVNRRSIPHLHTPCSPNHCIDEQDEAATKSAQASGH